MLVGLAVARFLDTGSDPAGRADPLPLLAGALLVVVGAIGQTNSAVIASAVLVLALVATLILLILDQS